MLLKIIIYKIKNIYFFIDKKIKIFISKFQNNKEKQNNILLN